MNTNLRILVIYGLFSLVSYNIIREPTSTSNLILIGIILGPVISHYLKPEVLSNTIEALSYVAGLFWLFMSLENLVNNTIENDIFNIGIAVLFLLYGGAVVSKYREILTGDKVDNEPGEFNSRSIKYIEENKEWVVAAMILIIGSGTALFQTGNISLLIP